MTKKAKNLYNDLLEAGYHSLQLRRTGQTIDGKKVNAYYFMVWSKSRNAFHTGQDVRIVLDESDVQKISEVAKSKGFLTFIDKDFNWTDNQKSFQTAGYHEWGFIFYPSHIVGRLKRVVSATRNSITEFPSYLQGDENYLNLVDYLKESQKALLEATKYALLDEEEYLQDDGFERFRTATADIEKCVQEFVRKTGLNTMSTVPVETPAHTNLLKLRDVLNPLRVLNEQARRLR